MSNSGFVIYFADTETSGLEVDNEIIELSLYRLSDDQQRTWCLKPKRYDNISQDALRINGHKLEDLKHLTKFGQETYIQPAKAIAEIEMWMLEDGVSSEDRILCGQNVKFDLGMLQRLWEQENCKDTFPFGSRPFMQDTREIALFLDLAFGKRSKYYNLGSLIKEYNIKNTKAHSAAADTLATKELFLAQLKTVQDLIKQP